ncbi:MAG: UDP-2,3-diacylglucosamine diphosphatase LpxI [Devosia sp.]
MPRRLSLIAGSGALPVHVLAAARRNGDAVQVLALTDRGGLGEVTRVSAGKLKPIIRAIGTFGATHLVLAGGIDLADSDREAIASALGPATAGRGDGALSRIGEMLANETGARLVGAQQIAPELLVGDGLLAGPAPLSDAVATARYALAQAREAGRLDLGQALVASSGRVVAVEDAAGTDALLARVGQMRRRGPLGAERATLVLAKASKPGQPLTVDLPAIGPRTIARAAAAGITMIALEAKRTLVLERGKVEREAARLGVSVLGLVVGRNG